MVVMFFNRENLVAVERKGNTVVFYCVGYVFKRDFNHYLLAEEFIENNVLGRLNDVQLFGEFRRDVNNDQ